jgi:Mannosyl-glycoprotein endo-beta-N-acetylglucosaminidase
VAIPKVTQGGGEQTQDTSGQFSPQAYQNSSNGLPSPGPLSTLNLPSQTAVAPAPQGAQLAMSSYAVGPLASDLSPLIDQIGQGSNTIERKQAQDYANAKEQAREQERLAKKADDELANRFALQNRQEALDWHLTGKDSQGNLISANDLARQQEGRAMAAGVSAEGYRLAGGDAYQIIKQKEQDDLNAAKTAQERLDKGIRDQRVATELLQYQVAAKDRRDPLTGAVDVHTGLNQLYDISDKLQDPLARTEFLEQATKKLMEETHGDAKREELVAQITYAEHRKQELTLTGMSESEASDRVRAEMAAKGVDSPELGTYLTNTNGERIDAERAKAQEAQEKIANRENTARFIQEIDPKSLDSILHKIPNVRNTENIRKALSQLGSEQAIALRDKLDELQRDAKEQTSRAQQIFKLETSLKEAQDPKPSSKVAKATQQQRFDEMVTRGAIPAALLKPDQTFNVDTFTPDGKNLSDKGRVYLGTKNETLRLLLAQVENDPKLAIKYFNPDGSYTPEGSKKLRYFEGIVPHDVYEAMTSPSAPPTEGTDRNVWKAKVESIKEELQREKAEYDAVQQKYKRVDGANFDAYPNLDQRRKGYIYKNNVETNIGVSPVAFAGTSAVVKHAAQAINTLQSGDVEGTNNGRRACAWAVSTILQKAGVPVKFTLSTTELNQQFKDGLGVPTTWRGSRAGDVVISPTSGDSVGHTGICMNDGCTSIASNSGNAQVFQKNFSKESWIADLQDHRGLPTYIYHPKGDPDAQRGKIAQEVTTHDSVNRMEVLVPTIVSHAKKAGIPPSFMLAQAMLESGYGSSPVARGQNNYFGVTTNGEGSGYRSYPSAEANIAEQAQRLTSGRYKAARTARDGHAFAQKVANAGYASDPNYAQKISQIITKYNLAKYDPPRQIASAGYAPRGLN